jgi:hypothetical protein
VDLLIAECGLRIVDWRIADLYYAQRTGARALVRASSFRPNQHAKALAHAIINYGLVPPSLV